ncbi:hypothetical protein M3Y99_00836700 [Aphelenchoides fujianensis]|nr:hypothetical protein M3Y99_00836700 [Aphelenchoides fujianensis]
MLTMNDTNEKLASIQTKIETINERLEAGRLYSISSCGSESISVFERTRSLFRLAMEKQSFYAHFIKLLALFVVAVAHLDWSFRVHVRYQPALPLTTTESPLTAAAASDPQVLAALMSTTPAAPTTVGPLDAGRMRDLHLLSEQMGLLADYKRNTWMTVAVMCVALCTSSFFLFILPITETCKKREMLMAVIDLLSFASVPVLLTTRIFIVQQLDAGLAEGMRGGHRILTAERLMNTFQCTIHPSRKGFRSARRSSSRPSSRSSFSMVHPPLVPAWSTGRSRDRPLLLRVHRRERAASTKSGAYARCPSMSSIRPTHHHNRAYTPVSLASHAPFKPIINPAALPTTLPSAPLLGMKEEVGSLNESIPQEPRPTV